MLKFNKFKMEDGFIRGDQSLPLPTNLNYGKFVVEKYFSYKEKIALINGVTGEKITYAEIAQQIVNAAASLAEQGVKRGEVVGICSENRTEFLIINFAVIYIGAKVTFINSAYGKDELIHTTKISKPKYIFLSPATFKMYYNILSKINFIETIFMFGDTEVSHITCFKDLIKKHVNVDSFKAANIIAILKIIVVDKSETAIIVYSSGTTGLPKGALWTHANLIIACLQPIASTRSLTCLTLAPWTNTVGYICTTDNMINGNTVVYLTRFNENLYIQTIEKYKTNFLVAVPPLVVILCKSAILNNFDVSSVEIIYCGGAPLDDKVIGGVKKRFPKLKYVLQGYGMTEAAGAVTEECEDDRKQGSVGRVVPGIVIKVVDIDSRKILGPNQPGEVCINGPALFGGYIGKDSKDDYDEQGFYKTGDVAYYDEEGYFFIVDRLKELIKYKAWQVAPSELEALLLQHPGVKDAGVVGRPDPLAGELPTAFVVKQPNINSTEKEIFDFVAHKVSPWKHLRGGVRFVEAIPKNGSGKILRRELRKLLTKSLPSKL